MAIPTSLTTGGFITRRAGVRFSAFPSDPTFWTEVQCSSSTAFATSRTRFQKLAPSAANAVVATFEVPYSTVSYAARARHYKVGYSTGAWTTIAKGTPSYLVAQTPHLGYYAHHVAQQGLLTTAFTKTIRIPGANAYDWSTARFFISNQGVGISLVGVQGALRSVSIPITFPTGVTITKISVRLFRASTHDTIITRFRRDNDTSITTFSTMQLTTSTPGSGSWVTLNSSALSEIVRTTANAGYMVAVSMKSTHSTALFVKPSLGYVDATYTMPHIGAAY